MGREEKRMERRERKEKIKERERKDGGRKKKIRRGVEGGEQERGGD